MDDTPGLAASDPSPVVGTVDLPEEGWVETIQLSSPPRSGQLSPESPGTIAIEDLGDSSVPLIVSRRGDHRRFRRMAVCLTCRQFRQDF